ncbi:hypothetical protein PQZ66_gp49 [Klebsiella phage vB_KleM_KB2]|nr:hypothetical protein PQZ66_gp49 [Klebsiella phage vB_KleM_KB2]DAV83258.1 MAG TPA: hypothetical protein [Caudoviricetes sp.]
MSSVAKKFRMRVTAHRKGKSPVKLYGVLVGFGEG